MMDETTENQAQPAQPQPVNTSFLAEWLQAILDEQAEQTKQLKGINRVINIVGLIIILGFLLDACNTLFGSTLF